MLSSTPLSMMHMRTPAALRCPGFFGGDGAKPAGVSFMIEDAVEITVLEGRASKFFNSGIKNSANLLRVVSARKTVPASGKASMSKHVQRDLSPTTGSFLKINEKKKEVIQKNRYSDLHWNW